ncbi:MAG: methyltransferase domain-containing protein [Halioglobus sp.]|nr:methyltransferase domain-containing protein [Halioglobus sp.]
MSARQPEPGSTPTPDIDIREIKTFYDSVYHADAHASQNNEGHYQRLFRKLGMHKGSQVLDVACGTGGWLKVCHDHGTGVSGVDLSDNAIKVCRQLMPSGTFHAQPAETLPFEDDTFDLVTCLGSLEHFVDPHNSLREMVRVAKPDATFVILVPNKDFLTRKLGLFGGTYQVDAKEVVRTLDEWQSLFQSAGLDVAERWRDLHVINRHWITKGRIYTWPFRLAQSLLLAIWPLKWQYQVYHRCLAQQQHHRSASSINAH